jgi:carboxyl-terminal processing protease
LRLLRLKLKTMQRKSWPWLAAVVLAAAACFFFLSGRSLPKGSQRDLSHRGFQHLGTIIQLIKYDYVEEPNPTKIMDGAFRGLVDSLDLLSSYLGPADAAKYRAGLTRDSKETGAVIIKAFGGLPQVIGLIPGSPAEKGGLKLGDYLSDIDGRSTFGLSLVETRLALRGRDDRSVRVRVLRQNDTLELVLKKARLEEPRVSFSRGQGLAGVLRVGSLSGGAAAEAQAVLARHCESSALPLVLDLRNCVEGDADEAGRLVNLFLQADPAGEFLERQGARQALACPESPRWERIPLAVWTNVGTQGAAEVAAAVLQDFGRAKVVGLKTPGLAGRTSLLPLQDGSALLLTTGVFALKSGVKIWGQGVKPESEVDFKDSASDVYLKKTLALFPAR